MTQKLQVETKSFCRQISRENCLYDNATDFLYAVATDMMTLFEPESEDVLYQQEYAIQKAKDDPPEGWDVDFKFEPIEVEVMAPQDVAIEWFATCIKTSKVPWTYEDDRASIDIDAVAKSWRSMLIPRSAKVLFESIPTTDQLWWHLTWDWFLPVVPLQRPKALGKELALWSQVADDPIARLAVQLRAGGKKPPVRDVWAALPALKFRQRVNQLDLLAKALSLDKLDALVSQLEEYCTPP